MKLKPTTLAALAVAAVGAPATGLAQIDLGGLADVVFQTAPIDQPVLSNKLLARAKPDECFDGVGNAYPPISSTGTCAQGKPKTNQAYVWGLTQVGKKLWFGTAPNVHCLVIGGFLGSTGTVQTSSYVCEFGSGWNENVTYPGLPDAVGDWRPAKAYEFNTGTGKLTERTPTTEPHQTRFRSTTGIRSAGSLGNVAILAGPTLDGAVAFFAYASDTGNLVDSCRASNFTNIRQWLVMNGSLYAGVAKRTDVDGPGGGIIRWAGTPTTPFDAADPKNRCGFELVSKFAGDAAYIGAYGTDRVVVSAWPTGVGGGGVYVSPPFGLDGKLDPADANTALSPVWTPSMYDPDPVVAATYGGGPIMEWKGDVYWGTMHVPGLSLVAHTGCSTPGLCYGQQPATEEEALELYAGTHRAISIFRGRNLGQPGQQIELLYGESELPAFDPATRTFPDKSTGMTPVFGHSGFGNYFNNYTWTMAVVANRLFIGTMDFSYLVDNALGGPFFGIPLVDDVLVDALSTYARGNGADLWRFDSPSRAAKPENTRGLGNALNYGIRTLITAADGKSLFAGMANPMNLSKKGGWELRRLSVPYWLRALP